MFGYFVTAIMIAAEAIFGFMGYSTPLILRNRGALFCDF